jgi:hypothetical protein
MHDKCWSEVIYYTSLDKTFMLLGRFGCISKDVGVMPIFEISGNVDKSVFKLVDRPTLT